MRRQSALDEAQMEYEKNKALGHDYVSEMDIMRLKSKYEEAKYSFDMLYIEKLSDIESNVQVLDEEIIYLTNDIKSLEEALKMSEFKSPISGIVLSDNTLNIGDFVMAEMPLLFII